MRSDFGRVPDERLQCSSSPAAKLDDYQGIDYFFAFLYVSSDQID